MLAGCSTTMAQVFLRNSLRMIIIMNKFPFSKNVNNRFAETDVNLGSRAHRWLRIVQLNIKVIKAN